MRDVVIIAATRKIKNLFERRSYLGRSLQRMSFDCRIEKAITYENAQGLPSVFNRHIVEKNREKILVFTHDDVRVDDFWLSTRLNEGLRVFDVLGVAGNRRLHQHQTSWAFTASGQWDKPENLSGGVCHVERSGEQVSVYGDRQQRCKLLDGVLIAAKASTLIDRELRFDDQFAFHFYDLDFCRSAVRRGLKLGTWPIAVTHASGGSFGSPAWEKALRLYKRKWRH